jgi:glycosyltransferase involved in cell wall biosynthesis
MKEKIAYLAFGHVDVTLPLISEFEENNLQYELILCFSQNKKKESVIDFRDIVVPDGLLRPECNSRLFVRELLSYYPYLAHCRFFIFKNLKLKSISNIFLAIELIWQLRTVHIIHLSGDDAMVPVIFFLSKIFRKKLIWTLHDYQPHSGERFSKHHGVIRPIAFKLADAILLQNKSDLSIAGESNKQLKNKLHYLPFGILSFYKRFSAIEKPEYESDFLFFGRISTYKGLAILYDAYLLVEKKYPDVKLTIAGSGYDETITKWQTHKNVTVFNRYLNNQEIASLINGTKIVICPYTDVTQSGVLMTALAFNKPVLATRIGSFEEIIDTTGCGILVEPSDPVALATEMVNLIEHPEKIKIIERNINHMMSDSEYAWGNIGKNLITMYEKIRKE